MTVTGPEFTFVGIQPAMIEERTEMPHPYNVNRDGTVRDQEFWGGDPYRLVGFMTSREAHTVDVRLGDFIADPERARGGYAVFARLDGSMFELSQPVAEIDLYLDQAPDKPVLTDAQVDAHLAEVDATYDALPISEQQALRRDVAQAEAEITGKGVQA